MIGDSRVAIDDAQAVSVADQPGAEEEAAPPEENAPQPEAPPGEPSEAEREEARETREREEALATPEAVAEREASRYAYTDLAPEQAEELLRQRFAPQLEQIDADPSRVLSNVTLEQITSPTEALVTIEGEKALLESSVPLRAPDDGGDVAKVDLGLEETDRGYAPENSLADLSLPRSAAGQIQVGEVALSLATEKAATSIARPFGEEDLYLPEVAEDTGLLLSPITGGVEVSALVLSRNSPEQLSFAVTLPAGAELRPSQGGGGEVIDVAKKELLATISAAHALDAQGTVVPVALSVMGSSVLLEFPHRAMDIAYPAFIDPEIEEHWEGFADTSKLNYWTWQWSGVPSHETYIGARGCIVTCWGNGLYVRSRSNTTYPAGSYGRWWFVPQGQTTYMRRVIFGPMNMDAHGCWANQPHGYTGVWNNGGFWSVHAPSYPSAVSSWVDSGEGNLGAGARTAFVGIHAAGTVNLNCGRDYRLGGAVLYLNDPEHPTIWTPSGYPTGWVKDNSYFTINVPVSDPGLGVKSATLFPKDTAPPPPQTLGCSGHYNSQCPANHTFQFGLEADSFSEGEKEVRVSATDAMTKFSETSAFTMKVDRNPPNVTLAGQLAKATDEAEGEEKDETGADALKLPVYNLEIKATDGSNDNPSTRRSGVKSIEVFLDEKATPEKTWTQPACSDSCGMTQTYTLKLNELTALTEHVLRVVIKDHAGNTPRERNVEFEYVPATGMKDEYVLHYFPLPNGQGNEVEEEDPIRPELAVNVMNGNLVYRQLDVEVPGPAADLEVERYYNSLLPDSQNTEWGDGWTLAQTPTLETEEPEAPGPPTEAKLIEESGAVDSKVELPEETGEEVFDEKLQAVVSKEPAGYAITDESGANESTLAFDEAGEATELRAPGYAEVDYSYEEGDLAEIAVDDPGSTDYTVQEAEEWEELQNTPAFASSFGSSGSAPGQFSTAGDIGQTSSGDFWVLDVYNHRIQKVDEEGEQLDVISQGGEGKTLVPNGLAVDEDDNVWITDSSRHIVEMFDAEGNYVRRFGGGWGTAPGQFRHPEGLDIDPEGDVLVTDMLNGRLQEFTPTGELIRVLGTEGPGPGQFDGPADVTVAPDGTIWVADFSGHDIEVLEPDGDFVRSFGSYGAAEGQFAGPIVVELGAKGQVWVTDMGNGRVQQFDSEGTFVRSFGEKGTGDGQFDFSWPNGIVADSEGNLWVTDGNNDRVQRWRLGRSTVPGQGPPAQDDPAVEVEVSDDLVDAVEGEEAGTHLYAHDGDLLTAHADAGGATEYEYENDRMTKVTLPNDTYAEIAYEPTFGRVKSVTVALEGANPQTTYFTYEDQPQRRTTVTAPGVPVTTYEFADDGSMLKWWNKEEPPKIDDIGGTLHDKANRETAVPIAPGLYNLEVQAFSAHGIASIKVIANNNVVVSEKTCAQIPGPPVECETEQDEWVMETRNFAPGILYLEVIATNSLSESTAERFWVNIPYTPPPDPEAEEPPRFADILKFREDFGLDLDIKGNEEAINDRIFNLIGDWHNPHTPQGEVARATNASWGVPLRSVDAAEMEIRETYIVQAATVIPQWVTAHGAGPTYAGYYVDHRQGGLIYVGFTSSQEERVTALEQTGGLSATGRLRSFSVAPMYSLSYLESLEGAVVAGSIAGVTGVQINIEHNRVDVGAADVAEVQNELKAQFGPQAPFNVYYQPEGPAFRSGQWGRPTGPVKGAERIWGPGDAACSAGFGAWDRGGVKPDGTALYRHFILTAGHCYVLGAKVIQWDVPGGPETYWERTIGYVRRSAMIEHPSGYGTDGQAIRVDAGIVPHLIRWSHNQDIRVRGVTTPKEGMVVCIAGSSRGRSKCGDIDWPPERQRWEEVHGNGNPILTTVPMNLNTIKGDSGGPIWERRTGYALGTTTGGFEHKARGNFTPLKAIPGYPSAPGTLQALEFEGEPLHIVKWKP